MTVEQPGQQGLPLADGAALDFARCLIVAPDALARMRLAAEVDAEGLHDSLILDTRCGERMTLHAFAAHVRELRSVTHLTTDVQLIAEIVRPPRVPAEPLPRFRRRGPTPVQRSHRSAVLPERGQLDRDDPEIQARLAGRAGERFDDEREIG